jgi:tetratricopeptide (TPR) repeat protein
MYAPAIVEARKAMELDDSNYSPHMLIALSYFFQGRVAEARGPAEEAVRLAPWDALAVGMLAGVLAQTGEKDRAEKLIATISGATPIGMTLYYLLCSEIDAAIDWYQRDIELRRPNGAMVASAGFFKPLRASPRWPKLAKFMNLPETASHARLG